MPCSPVRRIDIAYHLLDGENLASVQKHGLLSTERLVLQAGDVDPGLLRVFRSTGQRLSSGVRIRDQSPMPPQALARALDGGLRPEDWYALLNSKVFFWLDAERLNRQRAACGAAPQLALVIDAQKMLNDRHQLAFVSPINTGNARRAPAMRNRSTFVPYQRWVMDAWAHEVIGGQRTRPASHRAVELTIDGSVPNVFEYVLETIPLPLGAKLTS